ncbi:MAG TPA: DUF2786 domain-containing protein [Propionibacteriaceae bacterium]|nr:DUF2786 domain-containing protein [Propionibacteriaceae bacterium]
MGKNTQRRRAAKQRTRRQRGPTAARDGYRAADGAGFSFRFGPGPDEQRRDAAARTLQQLLQAAAALPPSSLSLVVADELATQDFASRDLMDEMASMRVRQSLVAAWEHGWQPLDLVHFVRRSRARLAPLLGAAVTAQARAVHAEQRAPQAWLDQLGAVAEEALPAAPGGSGDRLVRSVLGQGMLVDVWTDLVQLLEMLTTLPVLEQLVPPPSAWGRPTARSRPDDDASERGRLLNRIRTLLAKAENTEFAAEAETFTAKAQDLMTRHAIDAALLHGSADDPIEVRGVRVHINNPYAAEKVHLLNQVARANRSRAVWNDSLGLVTVLGTPVDVDQVEMLFTSLLIQATRAMAGAGARRAGSFDRSASFRRSFLMAYAVRIGERLNETSDAATASYGSALVPLLQRQTTAVREEFDRLFPQTRQARAGRYNALGWDAGRAAADRAVFAAGRISATPAS